MKVDHIFSGQVIDIENRRIEPKSIAVRDGRIVGIDSCSDPDAGYLMPGFIDAHVHIESSMLVPAAFAEVAVRHGTVATVSDPHEIANVLGRAGVDYMLASAAEAPLKVYFGAPSCVPATDMETAGAVLDSRAVGELLADPRIRYLSEMMNYPGVVHGQPEVMAKLAHARRLGKPVDGHAPGLTGEDLRTYVRAGISTDHEATTAREASEKMLLGMKIAIREGSAARNFEALAPLLDGRGDRMMLCSDDKHPDELVEGHIDRLVARAVSDGLPMWDVLRAACQTPVEHYGLPVGQLRLGDPADFIRVADLEEFRPLSTWIDGVQVAAGGRAQFSAGEAPAVNRFVAPAVITGDFALKAESKRIRVIKAIDGAIVTEQEVVDARIEGNVAIADPGRDVLKIAVVNRYIDAPPAVAFIRGFGLKRGAIASSVGHDSHNIVVVGVDDASIVAAVRALSHVGGGLAAVDGNREEVMPLPVAGLMATGSGEQAAADYQRLDRFAKEMGSTLSAPYMTLSFMALLVIPSLKLGDRGLFDGTDFGFVSVFVD